MKKKLWKKLCAPANLCTMARIAGAAALWLTRPETAGFYAIYALSGLSDALDGWLARRTGSADDFGARLDSAADLLFYGSMLLYMLPALRLRLPGWVWIMLAAVLAIRLCAYAAGHGIGRFFRAVDRVAQHGMADGGHVHANLMGAAGGQARLDERRAAQPLAHEPVGASLAPAGNHGHALAVGGMAADGRVHEALALAEIADDDGHVCPVHRVGLDLLGQAHVRPVVLGHQQQARRVLVDAVDDARADLAADAREVVQPRQQRVDQRARLVARRGMDDHARGLEHHRHVVVLIEDVQRDVLGLRRGGRGFGDAQRHAHAGLQAKPCLGLGRSVRRRHAVGDQRAGAGAGHVRHGRGEHVQPFGAVADLFENLFGHDAVAPSRENALE